MHESLSTFLVVGRAPISGRSEGNVASSSRSVLSRWSGTVQISERVAALTCEHQTAAAALTRGQVRARTFPRVVLELEGHHQVGLGIADQVLHDPLRLRIGGLAEVGPEPRRSPSALPR